MSPAPSRGSWWDAGGSGSPWQQGRPPWTVRGHRHQRWRAVRTSGPLRRSDEGQIAGGVAAGISRKIGVDATLVRLIFFIAAITSGIGFVAYVLGWLFLPRQNGEGAIAHRAKSDTLGIPIGLAFLPFVILSLFVASTLHFSFANSFGWSFCVGVPALVLVWRNAEPDERRLIESLVAPVVSLGQHSGSLPRRVGRFALGAAAVIGGLVALIEGRTTVIRPFVGLILLVAGTLVVFGPWWVSVGRALASERGGRAWAEERAEMASRLHDSVLQTLALIQRRVDEPNEVIRLARSQERELRAWLFEETDGGGSGEETTFGRALRRAASDVETAHGTPIETVVVGECSVTPALTALVAAGREAMVNAAKWSGAGVISLYAEVDDATAALFVRDRGQGFDPLTVAADRHGITESIRGRMDRHGGTATIRSVPGEGTEVALSVPIGPATGSDGSGR